MFVSQHQDIPHRRRLHIPCQAPLLGALDWTYAKAIGKILDYAVILLEKLFLTFG
jgi:hypothetical protein